MSDEATWRAYGAATVAIRADDGSWSRFLPRETPPCRGGWPFAGDEQLAVVTACNPRSRPRTPEANTVAMARLRHRARRRGLRWREAVTAAPDGSWREPSLALVDPPAKEVRRLARRARQQAVYWLDADGLHLVDVRSGARERRWWDRAPGAHRATGPLR